MHGAAVLHADGVLVRWVALVPLPGRLDERGDEPCAGAQCRDVLRGPPWSCSTSRVDGLASRRERREYTARGGTRRCTENIPCALHDIPSSEHVCMEHVV